jgi:hypothetical protein
VIRVWTPSAGQTRIDPLVDHTRRGTEVTFGHAKGYLQPEQGLDQANLAKDLTARMRPGLCRRTCFQVVLWIVKNR